MLADLSQHAAVMGEWATCPLSGICKKVHIEKPNGLLTVFAKRCI
jgi:hypothetical protein